ncbi:sulfotransferase family protein [Corallococcus sp. H22C18031201]|uniref:sulfotransferase n=1 Tax=Citreicoccus inhibens TaxID=2849499 RepID=UPI000E74E362|nr:sulfotransferase [Citreicoccus inhibens]MBU8898137.1 sulfotransferase [Citreicoccus inhibens]RJS18022.1 sulfotransferase family protein [Corallococcus sp. H22C18031201]
MADAPVLTVLYITGWCRSGSTILGNVLNELPGAFHVGELSFLWKNAYGHGSNTLCGCGTQLVDCAIWKAVLEGPARAADVVKRQQAAVRTRHTWRVLDEAGESTPLREHAAFLARTYRTIADATGSTVLVDSGKFPSEAALLPHVEGIRPLYLHLVRDPRAVTHSWTKTKQYVVPMSAARSTAYWVGFNVASEEVTRRHPSASVFLRYEDFIAAPGATVDTLLDRMGVDRARNPVDGRTVVLGTNHTVTGNPDRFRSGPTLLRGEDDAWRGELSASARATTLAMAWPLMARYGYFSGAAPVADSRRDVLGTGTRQ